jgi:hypothetical protein
MYTKDLKMKSISKTIWSDSDDETLVKTAKPELWSDCDEEALVTVALSTDTIPCDKTGIASIQRIHNQNMEIKKNPIIKYTHNIS